MCTPVTVIPVDSSASVKTNVNVDAVPLPVLVPQISKVPLILRPPHPVIEAVSVNPPLTSMMVEVPPTFTLPAKPMTGPPTRIRSAPVIATSTQTWFVLRVTPQVVPVSLRETLPTTEPFARIFVLTVVAEAVGAITKHAATANARIESFRLVFRTTVPSFRRKFAAQ